MNKNEILKAYGTDYKEMTKRLLVRADLQEQIQKKSGLESNLIWSVRPRHSLELLHIRRSWKASLNTCRKKDTHKYRSWKAPGLGIKHRRHLSFVDTVIFPQGQEYS